MSQLLEPTAPPDSTWKGDRLCKAVTRHHARTFYFASACLGREARTHAYRVYGFCRWVDNLVDDAESPEQASVRLGEARAILASVYEGDVAAPALRAFRRTVVEREIPRSHFDDLLDGMEMDLVKSRYADFAELELYCHRVAGVVGYMMAQMLGYRDPRCLPQARALGIAMQLTNILRDIREDFERGRVYLPESERAPFGIDDEALASHRVDDGFREFMKAQVARARSYYREAEAGVPDLLGASNRLCVRVMGRLYAGILDAIERLDYDIFRSRARTTLPTKLAVLARSGLTTSSDACRAALFASTPPRPSRSPSPCRTRA